jgi:hypothetical protein
LKKIKVGKLSWTFDLTPPFEEGLAAELQAIQAEAMGWLPLDAGAYFHQGLKSESEEALVIQVVGIPDVQMAGMNVLLLD